MQDEAQTLFSLDSATGWITRREPSDIWRQVCWLPGKRRYQPKYSSHGQTILIGSDNGAVTILDFSSV
jgi:hypothetical protein